MNDENYSTGRTTVREIESILGKAYPVLDHGFVRVVDYMGGDSAIVQAARVSYGKGTKKISQDRGLIRYLLRRRHTTPFEMCELKLHVKLPIFVARQWIRHRTANVNEYSARYSILDKEFYIPDRDYLDSCIEVERLHRKVEKDELVGQQDLLSMLSQTDEMDVSGPKYTAEQSADNKQGRGAVVSAEEAAQHIKEIKRVSSAAYTSYEKLMNEGLSGKIDHNRTGLARELARMVLPTNYYTQWYWKIDLHNLLHFVKLRIDKHAQHEIQEYARVIGEIVKAWVPITWEAFEDYQLNGVYLSGMEVELVSALLKEKGNEEIEEIKRKLSERERREFAQKFGIDE